MKKSNKFLAVLLSLALCVGMASPAFAADISDLQAAIDGKSDADESTVAIEMRAPSDSTASSEDEDTASGEDEDTASGEDEDTASGEDEDTASGEDEDTASGEDEDTASSEDEDTASGEDEDTASGEDEDTASGEDEGTASGEGEGTASGEGNKVENTDQGDPSTAPEPAEAQKPAEAVETYADGTRYHKNNDGIDYFGYAWNAISRWWGIEAWNEKGTDDKGNETTTRRVQINEDVTGKQYVSIASGKDVALDLNGNTISSTSGYGIVNQGDLELTNGTVEGTYSGNAGSGIRTLAGSNTTIADDVTVKGESKGKGIYVSGGTVETAGAISDGRYGIYVTDKDSVVNITGGTVSGSTAGIYTNGGTVNVNDGVVNGTGGPGLVDKNGNPYGYGIYAEGTAGQRVNVFGGLIKGLTTGVMAYDKTELTMSGGEIKVNEAPLNTRTGKPVSSFGVLLSYGSTGTVNGGTISLDGKNPYETYGIAVWRGSSLTVNNGTITGTQYAISGNGTNKACGGTTITVKGGTMVGDTTGIYHPQIDGTLDISGGTIIGGKTGVEVRAGTLNVSGEAQITGKGGSVVGEGNGNGVTVEGAGIAVSQHTTKQPINISISGGTITGYVSLFENAYQDNTDEELAKVILRVTGGKFVSTASPDVSKHKEAFVIGGMNTHGVDEKYLGCLTPEEMAAAGIVSTLENPTGQVNCIKVKNSSDPDVPFHVGYLTGDPTAAITMKVGDKSSQLVPQYKLSGNDVEVIGATCIGDEFDENTIFSVIIDWKSGDESVATVDENGVVTAVGVSSGPVDIIATLINGETVTFTVNVTGDTSDPIIPDDNDDNDDDDDDDDNDNDDDDDTPDPSLPDDSGALVDTPDVGTTPVETEEMPVVDEPLTDIPKEEVPLAEIEAEEVPPAELPDEDVPLADVPLADVPQTGDSAYHWDLLILAAAVGLLALRKREDTVQ